MNAEFFDALELLEKEKGIPVEHMMEKVKQALLTAYKRDHAGNVYDNVVVEENFEKKTIKMYVQKTVVEEVEDDQLEISLDEAKTGHGAKRVFFQRA